MKAQQFFKFLKSNGVTVSHRTNHVRLDKGNKWTTMRRHPSQEVDNQTATKILKRLGLK